VLRAIFSDARFEVHEPLLRAHLATSGANHTAALRAGEAAVHLLPGGGRIRGPSPAASMEPLRYPRGRRARRRMRWRGSVSWTLRALSFPAAPGGDRRAFHTA